MNIHRLLTSAFLFIVPLAASASWQVTQANTLSQDPFFQADPQIKSVSHSTYKDEHYTNRFARLAHVSPMYAISISGSVKENLERIMGRYHWRVIWKSPYDYNFDGKVSGTSLPNVVEKLLQPFPLQAVMYMSNRTLTVSPRYNA